MMPDQGPSPRRYRNGYRRTIRILAWRQDVNDRADFGRIEALAHRAGYGKRDPVKLETDDFRGPAGGAGFVITVPQSDEHIAVLCDELPNRTVLGATLVGISAHGFKGIAGLQWHHRRRNRPFEKLIEFGNIAGHDPGIEIPAIFIDGHRQWRNEPGSVSQCDARNQPVGALGECRQYEDRHLAIVAKVVTPQGHDDRCDLPFKVRHIGLAQVAMAGRSDDER